MQNNYLSDHIVQTTAGIRFLDAKNSFQKLSDKEKKYVYYFSQASWQGAKICYFQRSYESPALFYIFQKIFIKQNPAQIKKLLVNNQFTDQQIQQIFVYIAALFQNCGNYLSFGDKKFIPEIEKEKFIFFIKLTDSYQTNKDQFDLILSDIIHEMFSFQNPFGMIGLINNNGLSSYYSGNMKQEEIETVNEYMKDKGMSALNTRIIKQKENNYILLVASIQQKEESEQYKNIKIIIKYGDFCDYLKKVNENLMECKKYAANQIQEEMIEKYIEHFEKGDIEIHRESQKLWIMDKSPIIETNLGFIEHYLDPMKVRAEWEGFVAIVDKEKSTILQNLVDKSEQYIKFLPWGSIYENSKFNRPDFTALDVVSFASSGTPIGINIPNYDDIREKYGFKNVDLQNAYGKLIPSKVQFVCPSTLNDYVKNQQDALFVIVALHELLGHGTGKLFQEDKEGNYNFNKQEGQEIGFYKMNESYSGLFGEISSGYEECKADTVALFLSVYDEVMETLLPGKTYDQKNQVLETVWLEMVLTGLKGLRCYDANNQQWLQAHCQAAYAILNVLITYDPQFVTFTFTQNDSKEYIFIDIDRQKIKTSGFKAVSEFLKHLQIYKSTANVKEGTAFFEKYCKVDEFMLKVKRIIDINKQPRSIELQGCIKKIEEEVQYKCYEESFEGVIESHVDHYQQNVDDVYCLWQQWKDKIRYQKQHQ